MWRAGQGAALAGVCPWVRKVRAPQGRALGNTQAAQADGKWHRNYTASGPRKRVRARVKWWGKSPPASRRRGGWLNPARSKAK